MRKKKGRRRGRPAETRDEICGHGSGRKGNNGDERKETSNGKAGNARSGPVAKRCILTSFRPWPPLSATCQSPGAQTGRGGAFSLRFPLCWYSQVDACKLRVCRGRPHPRGRLPFPSTSLRSRLSGGQLGGPQHAPGEWAAAAGALWGHEVQRRYLRDWTSRSQTSRHCRDCVSRVFQSPTSSANHPTLFWMSPKIPEPEQSRWRYAYSTCGMYMTLALRPSDASPLLDPSHSGPVGKPTATRPSAVAASWDDGVGGGTDSFSRRPALGIQGMGVWGKDAPDVTGGGEERASKTRPKERGKPIPSSPAGSLSAGNYIPCLA